MRARSANGEERAEVEDNEERGKEGIDKLRNQREIEREKEIQ